MEIWKAVPNYEGYYEVSSLGRVKSLARLVKHSNGGKKLLKERIRQTPTELRGYSVIALNKKGVRKVFKVHVLVIWAFTGWYGNGRRDMAIDHINEVKTDNRLENLRVISARENISRSTKGGTSKYTGVAWYKPLEKWRTQIVINGKVKHLGVFTSELEASKAYQKALAEIEEFRRSVIQ